MYILRDIYLEIGEIFAFPYEKNQNGSYRVNTIIRNLVYPELFNQKEYNENDICYYLAHPEFSYQAVPNIRNSFSELMNPKKNSSRYPVIIFCNEIDVSSMYQYYKEQIVQPYSKNQDTYKRLQNFLTRIFDENPAFHAKLKLSCCKEWEFLTWIVLFSMFKDDLIQEKYEKYLETLNKELADLSISESGARHKLSAALIAKKGSVNTLKKTTYVLCSIEIFLALLPLVIPDSHYFYSIFMGSAFCLSLLFLTLLILILRVRQANSEHKYADLQTYHDYMDDVPDEEIQQQLQTGNQEVTITPFRNLSHSNTSRNKFREYMKLTLYLLLVAALVISLIKNSFPLLTTWVSLSILAVVYADRFYSDYLSRTYYDKKTLEEGETPNPWRGLAKIYQSEYNRTHFDLKDPYYDTIVHVHSGDCYHHIFLIAHDRLTYTLYVYNVVLAYFTAVFLLLEVLITFLGDAMISYLRLPNKMTFNVIISVYILAIGLYNLTTLIISAQNHEYLSKLAYASRQAKAHPEWAEKMFLNLYARGIIRDIDWMRGTSTYNMACFEEGKSIEDIYPQSDRMMFYHRHITFRPVAQITISLLYVAAVSLVVWHFQQFYLLLPITIFCILLYVYMYKTGLNRINQKKLIREIKNLSDCSQMDFFVSNR